MSPNIRLAHTTDYRTDCAARGVKCRLTLRSSRRTTARGRRARLSSDVWQRLMWDPEAVDTAAPPRPLVVEYPLEEAIDEYASTTRRDSYVLR